jgi:hypothetical protein
MKPAGGRVLAVAHHRGVALGDLGGELASGEALVGAQDLADAAPAAVKQHQRMSRSTSGS